MKHLITFILACVCCVLRAQYYPVEAVFVVADKGVYTCEDTMRIEGKMLRMDCDSTNRSYSRYAYVEVVDQNDSIVARNKVSCDANGEFITFLPVDILWGEGDFYLRAYTKFMTNYNESTFAVNRFAVNSLGATKRRSEGVVCRFYPEGAPYLIGGTYHNVGVKTLDRYGSAISADVKISDSGGEVVAETSTSANGWQTVKLMPQHGEKYFATVSHDGEQRTFELPAVESGLAIQAKVKGKKLVCRINRTDGVEVARKYKLCIVHPSIGLQLADVDKDVALFGLDDVSEGLITVFLLGKDNAVVSEASVWYDGNALPLGVRGFDAGAGVAVFDQPLDEASSVYYRFVDADEALTSAEAQLKYESNLTSPEAFPYGSQTDADAWLYSARYSRMDVEKTLNEGVNMSVLPEHELHIRGTASDRMLGPISKGTVVGYQTGNHSAHSTITDKRGRFDLMVGDFPQGERFFVEVYDRLDKPGTFEYDFDSDSLPAVTIKNRCQFGVGAESKDVSTARRSLLGMNQLPDVVVKARVSQERPKIDTKAFYKNKYISEETMEERHFQSFEQLVDYFFIYLRLKNSDGEETSPVGGAKMMDNSGLLVDRRMGHSVKVQIDGMPVPVEEAKNWNMDDIATAEYLSPSEALAYSAHAFGGLLRLTTKRPNNEKPVSKGIFYMPAIGISNYNMPRYECPVKVPSGKRKVLVDVISPKYGVRSYSVEI